LHSISFSSSFFKMILYISRCIYERAWKIYSHRRSMYMKSRPRLWKISILIILNCDLVSFYFDSFQCWTTWWTVIKVISTLISLIYELGFLSKCLYLCLIFYALKVKIILLYYLIIITMLSHILSKILDFSCVNNVLLK